MLKIVLAESSSATPTLRLEGLVIGPWVDELNGLCERCLARGARPILDLSEVSFVDREGIELLRDLELRGVAFLNCSPFVAEQLKAVATVEGEDDNG